MERLFTIRERKKIVDDSIDIIQRDGEIVVTITILSISDDLLSDVDVKFNCLGEHVKNSVTIQPYINAIDILNSSQIDNCTQLLNIFEIDRCRLSIKN